MQTLRFSYLLAFLFGSLFSAHAATRTFSHTSKFFPSETNLPSFSIYAPSGLYSNIVEIYLNTNLVFTVSSNGSAYIVTNTAPYVATPSATFSNNPTVGASYVYTNGTTRALLIGDVNLTTGVAGDARIDVLYTNSGTGYRRTIQSGLGVIKTDVLPFAVPLSPGATFQFVGTYGAGGAGYVTNSVLWNQ
jgi:hypothetical protein